MIKDEKAYLRVRGEHPRLRQIATLPSARLGPSYTGNLARREGDARHGVILWAAGGKV